MFYEAKNSLDISLLKLEQGVDFQFPPHLHSSFELITVTEGEMAVTVEKNVYSLHKEEALLIFPHQVHELVTPVHSCHFLCIFSPTLVQSYGKIFLNRVPENNLFRPDPFYLQALIALQQQEGLLKTKGLLYSLCAEFDSTAVYRDRKYINDQLLDRIFRFAEENYKGDCTLAALAQELSYHYTYLSKYFKSCTGITFTDYVNRFRVNEACSLLQSTDQSILKIAYECGFDSLRSFNRNFGKITAMTPRAYRERR